MKKRIYKINNKNLVTGNPNEVTENEILVKENNDGTVELSHRNNGTLETLGSGGNGGGATIEYLAGPFEETLLNIFKPTAYLAKGRLNNEFIIWSYGLVAQTEFDILGVSILPDALLYEDAELKTVKEIIISAIGEEAYILLPRMTEEEFYNLTTTTE